ncbi:hypothetical protein K0J45_01520 [Shewanella alkalitolerans]|uniref:hypothetical protein n=1 Tax=Shewanella alkalitolerans TaxID=2864209 RepID=UPI001C65574A|nr:hypothetical protein [Shewanella alkalitolerans]QYJ97959.1 hypothetical protein K0J45_01520 [Shewanella alkalitolerans]
MKKFFVAIILFVAFILYWQTRDSSLTVPIQAADTPNAPTDKSANVAPDTASYSQALDGLNYADCRNTLQSAKDIKQKWAGEQDWDQRLEQGYSIDDITLAMGHFLNENFAASWRAKQLKHNSQLSQINRSLGEQVKALIPDLPSFVLIEKAVPQPQLANIAELTQEEALALLGSTEISIDDLNWLLKQESLPQTLLLQALNQIEDVNALLGYAITQDETLHLIDTAAFHGRNQVVSALLNKGSQLTNDPYLGTTMEYALAGLDYRFRMNKLSDDGVFKHQIEIIRLLQSQGSPANFISNTEQSVKGFFPRHFYSFDAQQIAFLQQTHDLALAQILPKQGLRFDKQSVLMQALEKELAEQLTTIASESERNQCKKIVARVDQEWQPRDLNFFTTKLTNEGKTVTRETLNEIDPILADCSSKFAPKILGVSYLHDRELEDKVYGFARENKISEAISVLEEAQLNEAEYRHFFYQLLGNDPTHFIPLQTSRLHQDRLSYTLLYNATKSKMVDVITQGIDIDELDYSGTSLLDIAITMEDLQLLNYLISQHILYPERVVGRDPLYLLLDTSDHRFNPDQLMTYLPLIMSLEPPIQPAHIRLMALLRLKYTKLYADMTELYPQLIAPEDAQLPPAICLYY